MKHVKVFLLLLTIGCSLCFSPTAQAAQAQEDDVPAVFGSIFLSILYFPVKLVTCAATQATTAVAYVATFGVPGNYEGGTDGRQIGEVARKSCTGSWVISPDQVKNDYYP